MGCEDMVMGIVVVMDCNMVMVVVPIMVAVMVEEDAKAGSDDGDNNDEK